MHNDNKIDEDTGLPDMILDCNATKAAVDRVDQLCHNYSVQKRTSAGHLRTSTIASILQGSIAWSSFKQNFHKR